MLPGNEIRTLFAGRTAFRALIDTVLESGRGNVVAGEECARLDLGPVSLLAGDPSSPDGERLGHLQQLSPGMRLVPLDPSLLAQALAEVHPDLLYTPAHPTPEEFFSAGGFGFAVLFRGRPVGAITTVILSRHHTEVQVNVAERFRNRGIGTALGAALLRESAARGLQVDWNTTNRRSMALARGLGMAVVEAYPWFCLEPLPAWLPDDAVRFTEPGSLSDSGGTI